MSNRGKPKGQLTNIVNARGLFTYDLYGAMRMFGYRAHTQRRRVWIEGTEDAFYFDLAREKDLQRFCQWRDALLARREARRR